MFSSAAAVYDGESEGNTRLHGAKEKTDCGEDAGYAWRVNVRYDSIDKQGYGGMKGKAAAFR